MPKRRRRQAARPGRAHRAGLRAGVPPAARRAQRGARNRGLLGLGIAALIAVSLALPATGLVLLKMLPFDNKSEFQVIVDMPAGTPVEQTAAVLHELGPAPGRRARGHRLPGLCRHRRADQLQRPGAPVLPAQPAARSATCRSTWSTSTSASAQSHAIATRCARRCSRSGSASAPT
jgi:hypothetical protein